MATKAAEVEETVEEEEGGLRSQLFKHEAQAEWINGEYGIDLDELPASEIIAYAYATRVAWRKTDTYKELVSEHKGAAAEAAETKKIAAAAKAAEKAAAKAEAAAAKEAVTEAPAPAKKATKATATKATPAPQKATRARKGTAAAAAADSPFD